MTQSDTTAPADTRFGVDLGTFMDPTYWGVGDYDELVRRSKADPLWFWERTLDDVAKAGITAIELTFAPADYRSAVAAYGSTEGFRQALAARGLEVISGYFNTLENTEDPTDPRAQHRILDDAEAYAEFLAATGGEHLVVGLPMRKTRGQRPASFVDLASATVIADIANRVGEVTLAHGVQTALHTESHSVLWTARDIDLFMLLTDPMYVALCPDTGHIALAGADPVHIVDRHRERLVIAHWKDAIGAVPPGMTIDSTIFVRQAEYFRRPGAGVVDWFGWSRLLREVSYGGCTLLELDAAANPVDEMTNARQFISNVLSVVRP